MGKECSVRHRHKRMCSLTRRRRRLGERAGGRGSRDGGCCGHARTWLVAVHREHLHVVFVPPVGGGGVTAGRKGAGSVSAGQAWDVRPKRPCPLSLAASGLAGCEPNHLPQASRHGLAHTSGDQPRRAFTWHEGVQGRRTLAAQPFHGPVDCCWSCGPRPASGAPDWGGLRLSCRVHTSWVVESPRGASAGPKLRAGVVGGANGDGRARGRARGRRPHLESVG